ncbi:MAG: acetolactate synthase small subunit [Alphaproteobacteria bacterium]|nr:acetolactate synthase small subunit [Alphaproteobacteria bacterium]
MTNPEQKLGRYVFAVLVKDEPGVLARVVGLFSGRGYNIESLTVAPVDPEKSMSRIHIVTTGTRQIIDQIKAQLERLVPIYKAVNLTDSGTVIEREMALVKLAGTGDKRTEAMRLATIFRARVVDTTLESLVFEITGPADKVDNFIALMRELGIVELVRTGVAAITRGGEAL